MVLKRKRSESELSLSSSVSSTFSSPTRPFGSTFMDRRSILPIMPSSRTTATPAHLPSRTMKRFRNGRPSEETIHQRTLDILYSAAQNQQHQHQHQHHGHEQHRVSSPQPPPPLQQQQASLHSFWKLPPTSAAAAVAPSNSNASALPPPIPTPSSASLYNPTSCEDCGQALSGDDIGGGVDSMDIDGGFDGGSEGTSCGACGKPVCSHCSITNLGEQRRCLTCAGRRVVAVGNNGGLRWPSATATAAAGVGVC